MAKTSVYGLVAMMGPFRKMDFVGIAAQIVAHAFLTQINAQVVPVQNYFTTMIVWTVKSNIQVVCSVKINFAPNVMRQPDFYQIH